MGRIATDLRLVERQRGASLSSKCMSAEQGQGSGKHGKPRKDKKPTFHAAVQRGREGR
jgi:hypothetical protein